MGVLLYQGHASFRLETSSGLVFYIDPYAGEGYDTLADVILITHSHFDHTKTEIVPQKDDCLIIDQSLALKGCEYNQFQINDVLVEAVPAYNKNHPMGECVGYVIHVDGRVLYFLGDTGLTDEMNEMPDKKIDVAFIPCDGIFTMNLDEAREAADRIKPLVVVPIHTSPQYQTDDDKIFDIEVAKKFVGEDVMITRPGETISIS